ncbi:acyl-CoA reductase [Tellurirhabdus rosea]|uniref:acyl-CoA reductase n=1 Tax=Tellurirhabdus rosea TaxID=2674997 RepID=UPI00225160AB|nr:acyl-CoA reductase [Tellurirhabdus rosea]
MLLPQRIEAFVQLGNFLRDKDNQPEIQEAAERARGGNPWFTVENSLQALAALAGTFLTREALTQWTSNYSPEPSVSRSVGVVMAGNIPAVGFHDLLSILISGHRALLKPSSQDIALIQFLIKKITGISPELGERVRFVERINEAEAYIATGSDNTARYFEQYFAKKPHIIRKNRSSVALLDGQETPDDFRALGHDILDYFGLGCRNVSTLLVPQDYDYTALLDTLMPMAPTYVNHHKYVNNYDYNKSIYLVNGVPHLDNGFLLLTENPGLVSPISVVYCQPYASPEAAAQWLAERSHKIQVIASRQGTFPGSVPFGQTQRPGLTDYADGVDTMRFLESL